MTWEIATTILGVTTIIVGGCVKIFRKPDPPLAQVENDYEARIIKLEGDLHHAQQNAQRLEKEHQDSRRRHEQVIDGIYEAISELRKEVLEILKKGRG